MEPIKRVTPLTIDGRCAKCNALVSGYEKKGTIIVVVLMIPCGCQVVPSYAFRPRLIDED